MSDYGAGVVRGLVVAACVVFGGCAAGATAQPAATTDTVPVATTAAPAAGHTIRGTFTVRAVPGSIVGKTTTCAGAHGYDDVRAGMPVTVRDGSDAIVGAGAVRNFTSAEMGSKSIGDPFAGVKAEMVRRPERVCALRFSIEASDAAFYQIEAGNRGNVTYSRDELERRGWFVALGIGS